MSCLFEPVEMDRAVGDQNALPLSRGKKIRSSQEDRNEPPF